MMTDDARCTWTDARGRCILDGRKTLPDERVLCRPHRDELIDAQINRERRMTRRARPIASCRSTPAFT
jgi:hypothetical protein